MGRRLILDTGLIIAVERCRVSFSTLLDDEDDPGVAAISVAEFRTGVLLADTPARQETRQAFLDGLLENVPVFGYTTDTATIHAELLAYVRRSGQPRGAHDLVIAATAIETGRTVLTTDAKAGFGDLPRVSAIVV